MRAAALGLLVACGPAATPPATPVHVVVVEPAPATSRTRAASVGWESVSSTDGCFFFAGPGDLGRDEPLGNLAEVVEEEDHFVLSFGEAHFLGRPGAPLELRRVTQHDFDGKWEVTQSMTLHATTGGWQGEYSYRECQVDIQAPCPGHCTIRASVTVAPR